MMCKNLRILSNSAKFSAGRPLLSAHRPKFSATVASTSSIYRLGLWPPYNFWRLKICLELPQSCVLSIILDNGSQPFLNGSPRNFHRSMMSGQG